MSLFAALRRKVPFEVVGKQVELTEGRRLVLGRGGRLIVRGGGSGGWGYTDVDVEVAAAAPPGVLRRGKPAHLVVVLDSAGQPHEFSIMGNRGVFPVSLEEVYCLTKEELSELYGRLFHEDYQRRPEYYSDREIRAIVAPGDTGTVSFLLGGGAP